jgi:hypothetical protein
LANVNLIVEFADENGLRKINFAKKSSSSKAFYLNTPDGIILESASIARYIASIGEGKLSGSTPFETG